MEHVLAAQSHLRLPRLPSYRPQLNIIERFWRVLRRCVNKQEAPCNGLWVIMLMRFSRDLLLYLPALVVPALLGFVSLSVFTRILSVEQYGQYALVMSTVAILSILLGWLHMAFIRFYPSVPEHDISVLLRTSFWTQIVCGGCLMALAVGVLHFLWATNSPLQRLMQIGFVIFCSQTTFNLLARVLQSRRLPGFYSLFVVLEKCVGLGTGVLLAVGFGWGAAGVLWGVVCGSAFMLPFLWRKAWQGMRAVGPISLPLLRQLAVYGLPLTIGELGSWILNLSDRYQIKLFFSDHEVGIYATAYMISFHSIFLFSRVFTLAAGPLLANTWEKHGKEASQNLLSSIARLYVLVGIPIVVGMSVLAHPLMALLVGADFTHGYTIIPWVVSGVFFLGLQQRFNSTLLLVKRTQVVMVSLIIAGVLNIGLNGWLLPIFGYQMAAVTTLVSYLVLCGVLAVASQRHLPWPFPWATALRSLVAAGVMGSGLIVLLRQTALSPLGTLSLGVPIGIVLYGVTIWACGEMAPAERQYVISMIRKGLNLRPKGRELHPGG